MENKYSRSHIGETHTTNEGYELIIIGGGHNIGYCTVQIEDWVSELQYGDVKRNTVKYPYHPSVYGKGFHGLGNLKDL